MALMPLRARTTFGQDINSSSRGRPMVGAIRWDAWYDPADGRVAQSVEKSLGPSEYHYRMPFFGRATGANSVRIDGDYQDIMDREIAYAAEAGLSYWAFCTYAADNPMSNALKLYLASKSRSQVGFCLITGMMSRIDYFRADIERQVSLMQEPGYTKVLGDRPLYFVLSTSDTQIQRDGGIGKVAAWVSYVRKRVRDAGLGSPYFVLSEGNPKRAEQLCHDLNLDAVGLYATALGPFGGAPYSELVKQTEAYWDKLGATGLPLVPNIMTGWDTRPRLKSPPSWDMAPSSQPANHYYQDATTSEIAHHIKDAIRWIAANPKIAQANTTLIYAWNECDEGFGALVPTYDPAIPDGNTTRIKALAEVLRP